jgi:hypothetical protein
MLLADAYGGDLCFRKEILLIVFQKIIRWACSPPYQLIEKWKRRLQIN